MRYLLFFLLIFFQSNFVFSQVTDGGGGGGASPPPEPVCPIAPNPACRDGISNQLAKNQCLAANQWGAKNVWKSVSGYCGTNSPLIGGSCNEQCGCPAGSAWYTHYDAQGNPTSGCVPDADGDGEPDPPEDLCPSGLPKVDGQCPVCIGEQNPDGTCADDSGGASSGANNSTPTSSPDSGSAASTGGGGDDDGGDNGGGGGGGDNGGNNNSGGGSASSSASSGSNSSWVSHSGYGNWIPVAEGSTCPNKYKDQSGQWWCAGGNSSEFGEEPIEIEWTGDCNPTSKTYFSCITSQKLDGSNNTSSSGWTPISGYGNWIPVTEESNCPNKFKDASGNWWCSGGATGGGGSGTASSGGASGSAHSAAGECDPTSRDYVQCVTSGKTSSGSSGSAGSVSSGSASSSKSGAFSSLGEKGEFDGETHDKKMDELKEELDKKIADIKADIQGEFGGTISGTGTIQDFCKNIRSSEVCFGLKKWEPFLDPISAAIFLVACVMAFSIVLRG